MDNAEKIVRSHVRRIIVEGGGHAGIKHPWGGSHGGGGGKGKVDKDFYWDRGGVPTNSPRKTANFIVKQFGGKVAKKFISDNPYSDIGSSEVVLNRATAQKLIKFMDKQGDFERRPARSYSKSSVKDVGNEYKKGNTLIRVNMNPGTIGNKPIVTIYGPKKAKRMTVPYYD